MSKKYNAFNKNIKIIKGNKKDTVNGVFFDLL